MQVFNLAEELEKERKKNKELEERIDKAIKYIEEATKYPRGMGLEPLDEMYAENIIDILKGDNNE